MVTNKSFITTVTDYMKLGTDVILCFPLGRNLWTWKKRFKNKKIENNFNIDIPLEDVFGMH